MHCRAASVCRWGSLSLGQSVAGAVCRVSDGERERESRERAKVGVDARVPAQAVDPLPSCACPSLGQSVAGAACRVRAVCARARVCVRVCVRACECVCVLRRGRTCPGIRRGAHWPPPSPAEAAGASSASVREAILSGLPWIGSWTDDWYSTCALATEESWWVLGDSEGHTHTTN